MERLWVCFGYTKQAYYQRLQEQTRNNKQQQAILLAVRQWRHQLPVVETLKLHYLLHQQEFTIGRDALFDLLRTQVLLLAHKRTYVRTTDSSSWMRQYPDLTKNLVLDRPEQLLVADITYLHTTQRVPYLHLVSDAYLKKIIAEPPVQV